MSEVVNDMNKKVISYQELGRMAASFGEKISGKNFIGSEKSDDSDSESSDENESGWLRSIDEFVCRFLPSKLLIF